jgi:hypothetical protein
MDEQKPEITLTIDPVARLVGVKIARPLGLEPVTAELTFDTVKEVLVGVLQCEVNLEREARAAREGKSLRLLVPRGANGGKKIIT